MGGGSELVLYLPLPFLSLLLSSSFFGVLSFFSFLAAIACHFSASSRLAVLCPLPGGSRDFCSCLLPFCFILVVRSLLYVHGIINRVSAQHTQSLELQEKERETNRRRDV